MNELYAKIGQQHLEIEDRKVCYTKLLTLFSQVVSGEVDRSRVMVNLTTQQYAVSPVGERPAMPATINGHPVCVVAKDDAAA